MLSVTISINNQPIYTRTAVRKRKARKKPRKPDVTKREDAIELFRDAGIPKPEEFWDEFKATQRYVEGEEISSKSESKKRSTGKKNEEYDPFLGF